MVELINIESKNLKGNFDLFKEMIQDEHLNEKYLLTQHVN